MAEPRKKTDWPIVAGVILALVVVSLGGYVVGYFALSSCAEIPGNPRTKGVIFRTYDKQWQATIFKPAAHIEGIVIGKKVFAGWIPDPNQPS